MDGLNDEQAVAITMLQAMIKTLMSQGLRPDVIQYYVDAIYEENAIDGLMQTIEIKLDFDYEEYKTPDEAIGNEPREFRHR